MKDRHRVKEKKKKKKKKQRDREQGNKRKVFEQIIFWDQLAVLCLLVSFITETHYSPSDPVAYLHLPQSTNE